jgi:phosphatidylserine/phosphatidylglycerophosphate/cardiolipin synthase-like enzyme
MHTKKEPLSTSSPSPRFGSTADKINPEDKIDKDKINPGAVEILTGQALHQKVITETVLAARRFVWIATANLKDMHIALGRSYRPILESFDAMARQGVRFRVIHAELPSRPFRNTLENLRGLTEGALELQICPRSHWKLVIVDGQAAYLGSANFTGAGLGAKKKERRNLEAGTFSTDPRWVGTLQEMFDAFWMGTHCPDCAFRKRCPDPII